MENNALPVKTEGVVVLRLRPDPLGLQVPIKYILAKA